MSFLKAIGGLVSGAGQLANKYIDEELAQQRAQALADIQRNSQVKLDQYMNSDERQATLRANATAATLASKGAERQAVVDSTKDGAYQSALDEGSERQTARAIRAKVAEVEGTADAEAGAAGKKQRAISDNTLREVSPGQQVIRGDGTKVGENKRMTQQEVNAMLYRDGLKGGGAGASKVDRMSEAGKLQLQDINKQDETLAAQMNKALAEGTLKNGDEAWGHLQRQREALLVQKLRVFAREGLIDGGDDARNVIAAGASEQELEAAKRQARMIGGDYAAQFAAAIDGAPKKPGKDAPPAAAAPPAGAVSAPAAGGGKPSGGRSLFDRAKHALAPDLNAHAAGILANPNKQQLRDLLMLDDDNPSKPLTKENRQRAEQLLASMG